MEANESIFPGLMTTGLTKREYIAIAAMQGLLASMANPHNKSFPSNQGDFDLVSRASYGYADAMLAEGEKCKPST